MLFLLAGVWFCLVVGWFSMHLPEAVSVGWFMVLSGFHLPGAVSAGW
jgi:hypothetical protein